MRVLKAMKADRYTLFRFAADLTFSLAVKQPSTPDRTCFVISGRSAGRNKFLSAYLATSRICRRKEFHHQLFIQWQHCLLEPPAQQRIRDGLYTDTSISLIQRKTLIMLSIIITAFISDQALRAPQLVRRHDRYTHTGLLSGAFTV